MGRIKNLTPERVEEIKQIINDTYFIEGRPDARVERLRKLGYNVRKIGLRPNARCIVGKIHYYKKELRYQIGSRQGWYAWCIIFNPLPCDKVLDLNIKTFGRLSW